MGIFSDLDLGGLQRVLFPVIDALGGPDIQGLVSEKSAALDEAADVLMACSDLLKLAANATADGILENEEIDAIVAAAPDIDQAVKDLFRAITGRDEEEVVN